MDKERQVLGFEEAKKIKENLKFITGLPVKQGHVKMQKVVIVPATNNEFEIFWKTYTQNGQDEEAAIETFKDRPLTFILVSNEGNEIHFSTLSQYIKLNSLNINLDEYFE